MKGRILLIFAATLCIGAAAQTTVLDLTLDRAIEIALAENPTIKIADMVIQRYDYVRDGYIANLLPSASASGSYSRNVISQKLGGSISIQGKNTITAGATVGMPLFAPGVYASLRLTREQMVGAVEAARGSKLSLVNEVKKAFYNALLAQNSLEVLHSAESNIKEVVNNVRTLYNNGLAAEYDLISAEVQQSNLHPTIIQTENAIDISKMLLKMYLCLPENVNITLRGDLNDYIGRAKSSNSVFITDVDENSMLRSLDIQSRVLTQQLRVMRTQRMPVVAAFGNIQFMGQDFNLSGFLPGTGDSESSKYKYNWQHPAAVGVQVSVPIFRWRQHCPRTRPQKQHRTTESPAQLCRRGLAGAGSQYHKQHNRGERTHERYAEYHSAGAKSLRHFNSPLQCRSRYNAGTEFITAVAYSGATESHAEYLRLSLGAGRLRTDHRKGIIKKQNR